MDFQDKKFVIGIDLGTTNSAVSFVDLGQLDKKNPIRTFLIPQLTGDGEFTRLPVLPSFLYIPGEYDVSGKAIRHPWKKETDSFCGTFARDHGSKIPSRLVSSSKSWLCHARADRRAKILPWGSEGVEKVSPVSATAEYLRHIKKAWNNSVKDEDAFLENQFVVVTVPASFDEAARELTIQAAREAGFGESVTLLEEPLAAFYSWLITHENSWQNHVNPDDLILVCDVGGGTTDFTLITLREAEGSPRFERLAVGDHLILGGDNIDLAIAGLVESKFKKKATLSPDRWKTLCHKCRAAKEKIFEQGADLVRITLKGEGSSLISGTLSASLSRNEVEDILCRGFFPDVRPGDGTKRKRGKAMAEFGLPYEQEPAITRHMGWFLEKHRDSIEKLLGKSPMPDWILFNGGALKPGLVQDQIRGAIRRWFSSEDEALPRILENPNPDLAVALGASYYGLVKQGSGVRVGSGSPRSYYLGLGLKAGGAGGAEDGTGDGSALGTPDGIDDEIRDKNLTEPHGGQLPDFGSCPEDGAQGGSPGKNGVEKVLCVVERGLDEGSVIDLPEMDLEVLTNQPVSFDLFSSSFRSGDRHGDIVSLDDTLTRLAPMQTVVKFGKKAGQKRVPVKIEPEYTEMGTLALWLKSLVSPHRWQLQFQLRQEAQSLDVRTGEVFDQEVVAGVLDILRESFDPSAGSDRVRGLVKRVEKAIEKPKTGWPLSLLRSMVDLLLELSESRKLSPEHEARWLNLTGFCMRPGFGDAFDEERMRKLWKIYLQGRIFPKARQNALEWWIFMRRIAGGLKAGHQRQFFQDVSSLVIPGKAGKKLSPQEMVEVWMAVANMERLLVKDKLALGRALMPLLKPGTAQGKYLWSLSRIGARELLYGSVDRVIPPREAVQWIRKLMKARWAKDRPFFQAIVQLARKTGDRTRDISPEDADEILAWLEAGSAPRAVVKSVREKVDLESGEESQIFGEALPQGLVVKS